MTNDNIRVPPIRRCAGREQKVAFVGERLVESMLPRVRAVGSKIPFAVPTALWRNGGLLSGSHSSAWTFV